jgi:hypothetical protein
MDFILRNIVVATLSNETAQVAIRKIQREGFNVSVKGTKVFLKNKASMHIVLAF